MGMDDTTVKLRGAPVLDEPALSAHSKMIADKLTVSELMSMAVVALPPVVRVRLHQQLDMHACMLLSTFLMLLCMFGGLAWDSAGWPAARHAPLCMCSCCAANSLCVAKCISMLHCACLQTIEATSADIQVRDLMLSVLFLHC